MMNESTLKYDQLMDILDRVFAKVDSLHAPSHDFGTGIPIYRKEIHTIQAIGKHPKINSTSLAEHMGVTKGAISQTVAKLIKKGMISKQYAKGSKKEVVLEITDIGWIAFQNHERFHMDMFDIAKEYYGKQLYMKIEEFKTVMTDFNAILDKYNMRWKAI